MAHIEQLPNEILGHIRGFLSDHDSDAMGATCSRFSELAYAVDIDAARLVDVFDTRYVTTYGSATGMPAHDAARMALESLPGVGTWGRPGRQRLQEALRKIDEPYAMRVTLRGNESRLDDLASALKCFCCMSAAFALPVTSVTGYMILDETRDEHMAYLGLVIATLVSAMSIGIGLTWACVCIDKGLVWQTRSARRALQFAQDRNASDVDVLRIAAPEKFIATAPRGGT